MLAGVEVAKEPTFQHEAQRNAGGDGDRQGEPNRAPLPGDQERHVGTDHEQRAVRQVDDAHDAEDQRQPAGDEKEQQAVLDSVEELCEQAREIHAVRRRRRAKSPLPMLLPAWGEG